MTIHSSALSAIGNTPLIRLKAASEATGCEILGKAEFLNPGQSVKDRAALYIIRDAERRGQLRPGGTIVEGTAGNTGIGLSLVANALGYKTVIVIPETQSQEKKDALKLASPASCCMSHRGCRRNRAGLTASIRPSGGRWRGATSPMRRRIRQRA